ncbi:MAG: SDR family oxidoreductase [Erysipelotrichales bacterium]|nr:SDR family oxidoreductase [Erysipelotrichales bacterium]MBQ4375336.1 SDR family oxidoreductase [Erysipelotrichales bacterium]
MGKTAIVTGGTSGIGLETAKALAAKHGYTVYVFSRHAFSYPDLRHISCDVADEKAVTDAVKEVVSREGRLDLVVNCAGMGISGALEFTSLSDAKHLFDVNFFGTVNVNRASIEHLRKTHGRIINISSVAGVVPIPFQSFYSASKAAINSYSLALANELKPFGVSVCAVMPGDTATGFTAARKKSAEGDGLYEGRITRSVSKMEKDELGGTDSAITGNTIASLAVRKKLPALYTVGFSYKLVNVLMKILPVRLSQRLIYGLYAK